MSAIRPASVPITGLSLRPREVSGIRPASVPITGLPIISREVPLSLSGIVIPVGKTDCGSLIKSTASVWIGIAKRLENQWSLAYDIPPAQWEEIIAGAFDHAGFDSVVLTPRSGDHGRDVIATRNGVGCIKIIGSVKAYKPGHLVGYDDVRALIGVMSGERDTSKGIITTTSDFPPNIKSDPYIGPFLPTRLELMNGEALQKWLAELARETG
jgi:restriction system protein